MMNIIEQKTTNAKTISGTQLISDGFYCVATGILATGTGFATIGAGIGKIVIDSAISVGQGTMDVFKQVGTVITKSDASKDKESK